MANFHEAHRKTQLVETGYANNRHDSGGETYNGIARNYHPGWAGWPIIDTVKQVRRIRQGEVLANPDLQHLTDEFFKAKFWDVNNLDNLQSQTIAEELFDSGVNMGVRIAGEFLQEALNLLNRNERDFPDLVIDGIIGPNTLKVANRYPHKVAILKTLNGLQFERYAQICRQDETQETFFRGWLKRV